MYHGSNVGTTYGIVTGVSVGWMSPTGWGAAAGAFLAAARILCGDDDATNVYNVDLIIKMVARVKAKGFSDVQLYYTSSKYPEPIYEWVSLQKEHDVVIVFLCMAPDFHVVKDVEKGLMLINRLYDEMFKRNGIIRISPFSAGVFAAGHKETILRALAEKVTKECLNFPEKTAEIYAFDSKEFDAIQRLITEEQLRLV
jgi:hypothetical protein